MNAPNPAAQGINTGQIDAMNKAAQASGGGLFMGVQDIFGRIGGAIQQGWQWGKNNLFGKGGQGDLSNFALTKHFSLGQNASIIPGIGGRNPKPLNMAPNFENLIAGNNVIASGSGGASIQGGSSGVNPVNLPMNGSGKGGLNV